MVQDIRVALEGAYRQALRSEGPWSEVAEVGRAFAEACSHQDTSVASAEGCSMAADRAERPAAPALVAACHTEDPQQREGKVASVVEMAPVAEDRPQAVAP